VNKGNEKIWEFQILKISNSSRNQRDFSNDFTGKETDEFGAKVTSMINGIFTNRIKGKLTLDICFREEHGPEGKWAIVFSEFKEVGLKPSGQPAPAKKPASAKENKPIIKPAWMPRGTFLGHSGSIQKPSFQPLLYTPIT